MDDQTWKTISGIYLRSGRAEAKRQAKPVVKALRAMIKKRKGWGKPGDPPAKRTGKRFARKHIQARTGKDSGKPWAEGKKVTGKDLLRPGGAPILKLKAWTPIMNVLAKKNGWAYRPLDIGSKAHLFDSRAFLDNVERNTSKQTNKILHKLIEKRVLKPFAKGLNFKSETMSLKTTLE